MEDPVTATKSKKAPRPAPAHVALGTEGHMLARLSLPIRKLGKHVQKGIRDRNSVKGRPGMPVPMSKVFGYALANGLLDLASEFKIAIPKDLVEEMRGADEEESD
jgi:hypothetical protein